MDLTCVQEYQMTACWLDYPKRRAVFVYRMCRPGEHLEAARLRLWVCLWPNPGAMRYGVRFVWLILTWPLYKALFSKLHSSKIIIPGKIA